MRSDLLGGGNNLWTNKLSILWLLHPQGSSCGGNGPELSIKLLGAVDGGAANQDADLEGGRLDTSSLASFRAVQLSVDVPFPGSVLVQEVRISLWSAPYSWVG